jgi:hypothetical protein
MNNIISASENLSRLIHDKELIDDENKKLDIALDYFSKLNYENQNQFVINYFSSIFQFDRTQISASGNPDEDLKETKDFLLYVYNYNLSY